MSLIIENRILQPQPFDLVGDPVMIAGIGQGFEAQLSWRIHDGHDERKGFFQVGGGTGEHGQFQVKAAIGNAAFALDRIFVEVFGEGGDDDEVNKVIVPVIYAPRFVPGYFGYRIHKVARGDTLSRIARDTYGDASKVTWIQRANPQVITNPNQIFPGQLLKLPIGT